MRVYILMFLIAAAVTYLLVPVVLRLALAMGAVTQVRELESSNYPSPYPLLATESLKMQ